MECLRGMRLLTGPLFCMELRRGYISVLMHIVILDCDDDVIVEEKGQIRCKSIDYAISSVMNYEHFKSLSNSEKASQSSGRIFS